MIARYIAQGASAVITLAASVQAHAEPVRFASDVFIERFVSIPGGRTSRVLERAAQLRPGDNVIFVVNWTAAHAREFVVTNTMPPAVVFQRSAEADQDVSVDGGHTWGRIEDMRVRATDGTVRSATPEDVTHLRWRVPPALAARGSGQITYRGIVR
ncbi:MAG: hypothetical protein RIS85_1902 [Pseudomonadota bacterium]